MRSFTARRVQSRRKNKSLLCNGSRGFLAVICGTSPFASLLSAKTITSMSTINSSFFPGALTLLNPVCKLHQNKFTSVSGLLPFQSVENTQILTNWRLDFSPNHGPRSILALGLKSNNNGDVSGQASAFQTWWLWRKCVYNSWHGSSD